MGQAPSSQNARCLQKQARRSYSLADSPLIATSPSSTPSIRDRQRRGDFGFVDSSKVFQLNEEDDTVQADLTAHFCVFCDRSFDSKSTLEEHIRVHDPAYQNAVDRARTETEGTETQWTEGGAMMYSFCRVCEKDYKFEPEGLLNHYDLSEKHREIRCRRDLHPTNDRPELWCALCETRFTHSDEKRKHMAEMNNHNIRYRELMARASRVPKFDYSMLERPSSEAVAAFSESVRSRKAQRTQTRLVRAEEDNTLYYCTPCDRYFLSGEELALHQSEELCMVSTPTPVPSGQAVERPSVSSASLRSTTDLNNSTIRQSLLSPTPAPTVERTPSSHITRSMHDNVSMPSSVHIPSSTPTPIPVSRPPPPRSPSPPPPYEATDSIASLLVPAHSLPGSNVPPLPPETLVATTTPTAMQASRALPIPSPSIVKAQRLAPSEEIVSDPSFNPPTGAATASLSFSSSTSERPGIECPLCLDREDNLSSLACGHIFGTECIRETLGEDPKCPMCREPAALSDLRRVFLT